MSNTKPCWSWRYHVTFGNMSAADLNSLHKLCCTALGDYMGSFNSRWDITYVKRRINPDSWYPQYRYTRVKVHFKDQGDLVLFKLVYH